MKAKKKWSIADGDFIRCSDMPDEDVVNCGAVSIATSKEELQMALERTFNVGDFDAMRIDDGSIIDGIMISPGSTAIQFSKDVTCKPDKKDLLCK